MTRQKCVAALTRRYPFYSGCGSFANGSLVRGLAGSCDEVVWTRVRGGQLLVPLNDYIGRAAYFVGDLDRKISWICQQMVRPGDTVLDIGANLGLVTVLLSRLVGPQGQVHSFEPNPDIVDLLQQSIQRSGATNVTLHPCALGQQEEVLELSLPPKNKGAASLRAPNHRAGHESVSVPVRPLSTLLEEAGVEKIQFVKMDVEGFEPEVLEGARGVLEQIRPEAIVFECNDFESHPSQHKTFQLLDEYDYGFFSIPRCLMRMRVERLDLNAKEAVGSHDFIAVPRGPLYEEAAKLLRAGP